MQMSSCARCGSFVPARAHECPGCEAEIASAPSRRVLRGALAIAGGSLFAVTLSACYGAAYPEPYPYDDAGSGDAGTCTDPSLDTDGDGFCGALDCDETDPARNTDCGDPTG